VTEDPKIEGPNGDRRPFRSILAVCDLGPGNAVTLKLATELARAAGARLTVLAVAELTPDIERLARFASAAPEEVEARLVAEQRAQVAGLLEDVAEGLAVEVEIRKGKPFLEIIRQVLARGHDLVVKTAEELHGLHRFLFSSTDQHLLRKCPCPVWLRLSGSRRPARAILAAVDVDHLAASEPETQAALNRRIIETAAGIAAFEGAELHVLHVWDAPAESLVRRWATREDDVMRYLRDVEAEHGRALDSLIEGARASLGAAAAPGLGLVSHLERGVPRSVIPAQVHQLGADVLVMGTIARTGVPGFIIGNTAEDVLNSIDCSVVTVKPPGYVSPVRP